MRDQARGSYLTTRASGANGDDAIHRAPPESGHFWTLEDEINISHSSHISCLSSSRAGHYAWVGWPWWFLAPFWTEKCLSKQVENTGVIAERWKVWNKLNFARNYIFMTTPWPHMNNEREPMCFFFLFFFHQQSWLYCVTHVAVSLRFPFPACPEWFALQCCHGGKITKVCQEVCFVCFWGGGGYLCHALWLEKEGSFN